MKVVFLDVDGVLNSSRSVLSRTGTYNTKAVLELQKLYPLEKDQGLPYGPQYTLETIDPVAVDLVNRLIKESGAMLVLSTSHRSMFVEGGIAFGSRQHMHRLGLYFAAMGI